MKYFITSDTHFGHENVIKYCNRPFVNAKEMDAALIKNWNSVVGKNDTVLHLGDFALCPSDRIKEIISQLNGNIVLIMGNHDCHSEQFYRDAGIKIVSKFPIIWNDFFILSHTPLPLSETTPYFNYYGHVHNDEKFHDTATSKCVCVERTGYTPVLLFEKFN